MLPTLSLAIPTYNRSACLKLLLGQLKNQLVDIAPEDIEVLISDNCSTDDTADIIRDFCQAYPATRVIRNETNQGADFNIAQCFSASNGVYVWIMGDDELIIPGGLAAVVDLVKKQGPDILYLKSTPEEGDLSLVNLGHVPPTLETLSLSLVNFTKSVGVNFTFISGVILRKDVYIQKFGTQRIHHYRGTSLAQLEWVLGTLLASRSFVSVETPTFYSRTNNSGGYKLFEVFVKNYIRIVAEICANHPQVKWILIHFMLMGFLPNVIFTHRFKKFGDFDKDPFFGTLYGSTRQYGEFWFFLGPIATLPKFAASFFLFANKVWFKLLRMAYKTA